MSRYNMDEFKVAKVDESGISYYYYLYTKPKSFANSDNNTFYILRTNVAGTDFEYSFGITAPLTAWANKATQTYKDLTEW